ncbi:hypothetical protein [Rugamonas rivuli]|uniref:Uncharacterized protein n=1 Tax=Rugamonas rivuli TaxID=2743358 RepID=A0A843SHP0_9BURK|nr:hypothetical protein [Rugamonas rivuli]MQA22792.1 hypothetical protein [Rugamonas rivuli]
MSYDAYIEKCKAPKAKAKVHNIVHHLLIGIRKGYTSQYLADRLNQFKVYTLMAKHWTANSVQMQLLKMKRFDNDSSLAWGFAHALSTGLATEDDLELLASRVR